MVSILTGLERPVQRKTDRDRKYRPFLVSILTGLERPVQRGRIRLPETVQLVSILTGLERPVQRELFPSIGGPLQLFQSSPASKGRCNLDIDIGVLSGMTFQSSPASKGRCNAFDPFLRLRNVVSILTGLERPVQRVRYHCWYRNILLCFNPHRPRKAGATEKRFSETTGNL